MTDQLLSYFHSAVHIRKSVMGSLLHLAGHFAAYKHKKTMHLMH